MGLSVPRLAARAQDKSHTGSESEASSPNGPRVAEAHYEDGEKASKVRVMPSSSLGCGQGCLLLSIAIAILVMAFGCFGIWAIADYLMINVFEFDYRVPFSGMIMPIQLLFTVLLG